MKLLLAALTCVCFAPGFGLAAPVTLQQATATLSQNNDAGPWLVSKAIDGDFSTGLNSGWGVAEGNFSALTRPQTAAFETVTDVGFGGGTTLTFQLHHLFEWFSPHNTGRFRISATTAHRDTFADGLQTGGDVDTSWVVLTPHAATALGATLTILPDASVLASGSNPIPDVYTVFATTMLTGITGFRLELLDDASFPNGGPGRAENGNLVITEFTVDAAPVPEPSSVGLLLVAMGSVGRRRFRTRTGLRHTN